MESKLAGVAKLLRKVAEELAGQNVADKGNKTKKRHVRGGSGAGSTRASGKQLARLDELRNCVDDSELSVRTRGACSYAMHMYLLGHKHLLTVARQDPQFAQAVLGLINAIKDDAAHQPVQAYDEIYLQAVDTVALLFGKTSQTNGTTAGSKGRLGRGFVPIAFESHSAESREDEMRKLHKASLQAPLGAHTGGAGNHAGEAAEQGQLLPSFLTSNSRRHMPQDRLSDVLSGQPIPLGATNGYFAEAFDFNASQQATIQVCTRVCMCLAVHVWKSLTLPCPPLLFTLGFPLIYLFLLSFCCLVLFSLHCCCRAKGKVGLPTLTCSTTYFQTSSAPSCQAVMACTFRYKLGSSHAGRHRRSQRRISPGLISLRPKPLLLRAKLQPTC